ncbi:MAG TPA: tail fiber protein [Pyrinomonadaceae bacterium]|nr:tail fiber protein [Pyrinomonadaceae bacterium]
MAQPFVGEIRMFAGNFAPAGWMFCDGALLPISENETLFNIIGTTYGGDGESTFQLPDLRGRLPLHQGSGFILGETGGVEQVTLTINQTPVHNHAYLATADAANTPNPGGNVIGRSPQVFMFFNGAPTVAMNNQIASPVGGSQPHTNFQPYVCVNYIISLFGLYPSPT